MVAGIAPYAAVVILDAIILVSLRGFNPGVAGGGDALLMAILPLLGYLFACLLLIPCLAYVMYRKFKRKEGLTRVQGRLAWSSLVALASPPLLLKLLRWLA